MRILLSHLAGGPGRRRIGLAVLLALLAGAHPARGDWLNLTGAETAPNIAEITIRDDRVFVALEVYIGDLGTFQALLPDDWLTEGAAERPPLSERLARFSAETLQVLTGEGTRLPAQLKLVEPRLRKERYSPYAGMINPTTRQRVPEPPEDKRVLYAELEYPFDGEPRQLTIIPPSEADGRSSVTIGFIAFHKAVPIIDFRYLSGPVTVRLDWSDPWYSKFDNPNLKRHHKSPLMSFLYVEPREVRHEALIRVRDLQDWVDLGLEEDAKISAAHQTEIKARAREFFARRNPLTVDGQPVTPVASRAEFLELAVTGPRVIDGKEALEPSTAILGLILSYPVSQLPEQVAVRWELFNERYDRIPATAIDPAGPLGSYIEADDPTLEWRNFLKEYQEPQVTPVAYGGEGALPVPLLSGALLVLALGAAGLALRPTGLSRRAWLVAGACCLVGALLSLRVAVVDLRLPFAGPPDEKSAGEIASRILENINVAYLETQPAQLREALGLVVASESFEEVEAELSRALAIKVASGGIARVKSAEDLVLKDLTSLDGGRGFRSLAEWTAKASAGHWGHVHRRTIRFRAFLDLVEQDGHWKLAGITVVEAKQEG